MRAFRSLILATGLVIATSAAHASARVFVSVGPSGYPVYAEAYAPPCPGPGYAWIAGNYSYGRYYPGRWAAREANEREWRGRDWREHRYEDRDRHEDRDRYDHRDRDNWGDRGGDRR